MRRWPQATGELLVFSDANASWQREALKRLVGAFADPEVGYVCGDVMFTDDGGTNQEGLYWRYEMWLRRMESGLSSVTSGNGAIYATRRESYLKVDPLAGHDLSFPFNMVKRGWRAVYVTDARATEKMAPSIEGEFARKRRMARRTWPTVFAQRPDVATWLQPAVRADDLLAPDPALPGSVPARARARANIALIGQGWVYLVTLALQLALSGRRAGAACASASAAGGAVLRGHQLGAGGRAVGLAARRALTRLGDGRGHPVRADPRWGGRDQSTPALSAGAAGPADRRARRDRRRRWLPCSA